MKITVKLFLVISIFMCASTVYVKSQNLVLNPGFDSYITCPGFGQFSNVYINDWNKPTIGSSDYYHFNCAGIQPSGAGSTVGRRIRRNL
ncbi:MAG: hypothetical protein IPP71_07240 [Bacteroidetes bacterium]|nr:hypothetical protein [Bacteroidota bacterium]